MTEAEFKSLKSHNLVRDRDGEVLRFGKTIRPYKPVKSLGLFDVNAVSNIPLLYYTYDYFQSHYPEFELISKDEALFIQL